MTFDALAKISTDSSRSSSRLTSNSTRRASEVSKSFVLRRSAADATALLRSSAQFSFGQIDLRTPMLVDRSALILDSPCFSVVSSPIGFQSRILGSLNRGVNFSRDEKTITMADRFDSLSPICPLVNRVGRH